MNKKEKEKTHMKCSKQPIITKFKKTPKKK
jgi:hypothetical protein